MGVDKEATDIWKFGRPRPDLTFDESMAAPEPIVTGRQKRTRERALSKCLHDFVTKAGPSLIAKEPR
jgi:hypothetical protein